MARRPRDTAAGIFHVYTHSVWASRLYADDVDRVTWLRELVYAGAKAGWTCLAYCLMTTHYHLILDVADGALPIGMKSLNFRYAMAFNHRYGLKGHVHGRRYDSRRIAGRADLLGRFRYVVRNPVRAGMCGRPGDWPWSSYAGTVELSSRPEFVAVDRILECVCSVREVAVADLRAFVELS